MSKLVVEVTKRELMFISGSVNRDIGRLKFEVMPNYIGTKEYDQLLGEVTELEAILTKLNRAYEQAEHADKDGNPIEKPKLLVGKTHREGDLGPFCKKCGGSQKWRKFLWIFRTSPYGCVTPGCDTQHSL